MKKLIVFVALVCGWIVPVLAQTPAKDPAAVAAIKQLEQDLGTAMMACDIDKLSQFYADDFATIASGKIMTKESLLDDFRSGKHRLEWFKLGPIDVQIFGNVAIAHAGVKEKRTSDGKDTSGEFVWMDLLEKRNGKWVIFRSEGVRVE
jgi:ketosteroid isomerase-like protein